MAEPFVERDRHGMQRLVRLECLGGDEPVDDGLDSGGVAGEVAGLLMRSEGAGARVALGFPDVPTFENLATRVAEPLAAADIEVWLVGEDGAVIELKSSNQRRPPEVADVEQRPRTET